MPRYYSHNAQERAKQDFTVKVAEKAQFIEWLATPRLMREPRHQTELAELLGVTNETLRLWKKDPRVQTEVMRVQDRALRIDDAAEIYAALLEQAKDPTNPRSVQAAKVLLERMDASIAVDEPKELADMSLAEIQELATEIYDLTAERQDEKSA